MIRIVAGEWRGRRLQVPAGIRPTTELVRKAAFDILGESIRGARVLDAAAGSGAYGIEALSRGAERAVFLESDRHAARALASNLERLGAGERARLLKTTVGGYLARPPEGAPFDVVFYDPPYGSSSSADVEGLRSLLAPEGTLVHEEGGDQRAEVLPAPSQVRRYGKTRLLFFASLS